jgi:serine/threonine-protein kinase
VLDKRYIIEECIGEGGMGRVYRAKHTRMSRHYAIKILFGDHAGDTRMRSRFAREAEAVSRLSHVNVISVLDFGETEEGLLYLVMDLAAGESLAELVHREAPLNAARAIEILARLAKGLSHAHGHGLVHRDFKCENVIMVTEEGLEVPKIVDFGICMIVEDAPASTMLTSNGMIMGTPAVMAPEQASGDKVDHRTDLFSLGIVGYQMLSGCLPFEGTPLEMARKNLYEAIPPIAERSGINVDPGLEAVIHRLTAKNPDERFQNAQEALEALQALGLSGSFDSWTNLTPMPSRSDSRPNMQQPRLQSSAGFDATEAVSPLHADHTQYLAAPSSIVSRRKNKILFAALAGVATIGFVLAIALSRGSSDEDKEAAEAQDRTNAVATAAGGEPAKVLPEEGSTDGAPTAEPAKNPEAGTAADAGPVPTTPVVDPEGELEAGTDKPIKKDTDKPIKNGKKETERQRTKRLERAAERERKAAERERKKLLADRKNTTALSPQEQRKQQTATLKLYSLVGVKLNQLRKSHGDNVARRYQNSLDKINRTTLGQNMAYAKKNHGKLRTLLNQIIHRQSKK